MILDSIQNIFLQHVCNGRRLKEKAIDIQSLDIAIVLYGVVLIAITAEFSLGSRPVYQFAIRIWRRNPHGVRDVLSEVINLSIG